MNERTQEQLRNHPIANTWIDVMVFVTVTPALVVAMFALERLPAA